LAGFPQRIIGLFKPEIGIVTMLVENRLDLLWIIGCKLEIGTVLRVTVDALEGSIRIDVDGGRGQ